MSEEDTSLTGIRCWKLPPIRERKRGSGEKEL